MKEYISKEYVYSILKRLLKNSRGAEHYAYSCVSTEINDAPDSELVYMYECPKCGSMTNEPYMYCPYCGKPMDEVELYGRN